MTVDVNDRVLVTIANGVAELVLNRPDKRNALDDALFVALARATRDLVDDRSVRAVILAGNGAAFCAGLDFASFASFASESESGERPFGEPGRRGSGCRSPGTGQAIVANLRAIRVPVIAAIDGAAIGGGLQLSVRAPDGRERLAIAVPAARSSS
jgi:enoyl-CoA hydratase/carnithine racemase